MPRARICRATRSERGQRNPSDADAKKFLTISGSKLNKNSHGLRCATPQKFVLRASHLSDNKLSGLYLVGNGRVEDCTFTGNSQGVALKDVTDLAAIQRLTITNNLQYGLYAETCNLAFTSTNTSMEDQRQPDVTRARTVLFRSTT